MSVPDERTHEGDARPLAEPEPSVLCSLVRAHVGHARLGPLAGGLGLSGERTLVNLELDGRDESDVGRDSVTDGKGDEVARDERVGEQSERLRVTEGGGKPKETASQRDIDTHQLS